MDPTRLLDGNDDVFEVRLLRAARRDLPPPGAATRALLALGLSASTAAATAVAGTDTIAKLGFAGIAKWVGIGFLGGIVTAGAVHFAAGGVIRDGGVGSAAVAQHVVTPSDAPGRTSVTDIVVRAPVPVPTTGMVNSGPLAPAAPNRAAPALPPADVEPMPAPPSDEGPGIASLSVELSTLERARHALVAHRPDLVLRELDTYARGPRTGELESEATMLRIEALKQEGQSARAVDLATRALAADPTGPHAVRLREIVTSAAP